MQQKNYSMMDFFGLSILHVRVNYTFPDYGMSTYFLPSFLDQIGYSLSFYRVLVNSGYRPMERCMVMTEPITR